MGEGAGDDQARLLQLGPQEVRDLVAVPMALIDGVLAVGRVGLGAGLEDDGLGAAEGAENEKELAAAAAEEGAAKAAAEAAAVADASDEDADEDGKSASSAGEASDAAATSASDE